MAPRVSETSDSSQSLTSSSSSSDGSEFVSLAVENELAAMKTEIIQEIRAITKEFGSALRMELQEIRSELRREFGSLRAEFAESGSVESTVTEVKPSPSGLSGDVVDLKARVESLEGEIAKTNKRCEDLESRSRRQNIRLIGIPEDDSKFTLSNSNVSELLKETFSLDKGPLVDMAHRFPAQRPKQNEPPRPIIVRLHHLEDCARILKEARNRRGVDSSGVQFFVYPDFTPKVAKARAAFNEVRKKLRTMDGVKYGIFYPARLRITVQGKSHEFTSPDEAERFITTMRK